MGIKDFLRRVWEHIRLFGRQLWKVISHRFGLKLLSFVLAVLLWNYVISSNSSITRARTLTGLSGYVTGQATLNSYRLALVSVPEDVLDNVTVRLVVAQSQYSQATPDTVQVMLDLSSVRTAGAQQVPLRATTSYGRVTEIIPETVTVELETLDSRAIPVNVELAGEQAEGMWYNVSRTNPTVVTVSGAASVVRNIAQARVYADVTGQNSSYWRAEPYVLLDRDGNEISQEMLNTTTSSITVTMDIYPTKELPISRTSENVVTGHVADGYAITDISIQPESITVAADQSLLDGISELLIEPVNVEGQSQSMVARASIALLNDFRYTSAEQVYVNITIAEEEVSEWIGDNVFTFVGKAEQLLLEWQGSEMQVRVTGPRSDVAALLESGVPITVDLTGLGPGTHTCPLIFPTENYPNVRFEPEMSEINITLVEESESEE